MNILLSPADAARMAPPAHAHGLEHDLALLQRRTALRRLAAGALLPLPLVGCGGGGSDGGTTTATTASSTSTAAATTASTTTSTATTTTATTTTTADTASTSSSCTVIPEETEGPYPGDGSNSSNGSVVNALTLSGFVRSDIRSSVGSASGTAAGMPLSLQLRLVNTRASCANLAGYAIYVWHCTREGAYSLYDSSLLNQNYLRGVQVTDSNGLVTFTTIFPGCYSGRMPHIHLEVYPSLARATSAANKIKTSQLAFPLATCNEVYATSGYSASVANLARITFASDNVFSDGVSTQLATMSGNTSSGYTAALQVGIAV